MPLRDAATQILIRLRQAGFDAYFVGGCVRDMLLGIEPHDYDIATSALPLDVRRIFSDVIEVGAQIGATRVRVDDDWFEVAAFRSDVSYSDGRRPDEVVFTDARGDVERRDFTINGLLYDPLADEVLDYVGGRADIERRLIRAIGDPAKRFDEDKLRLLRAVRFAARFDFRIEPQTFEAIRRQAAAILVVSPERIGTEIMNILTGANPDSAFALLRETGLLEHVLPEVQAMIGVQQPEQFHPEGDVFEHTLLMLGMMRDPSPELALAVLLHDIGKPATFEVTDRIRFNEHAPVGAEIAGSICRRLRLPSALTERVVALVGTHMRFMDVGQMRESRLIRFLREPYFPEALDLHRLDCEASHRCLDTWQFCRGKLNALEPERIRPPRLVTGHDLIEMGYPPGPDFTHILEAVEDAQLEGTLASKEDAIEYIHRNFPRT